MSKVFSIARGRLWLLGALAAGGLAAGLGLFGVTDLQAEAPAQAPPAPAVSVAEVVSREVAPWDEFSGRLEAVERVEIRSRVEGTVLAVHFREGELVQAGDPLVQIDPAPYVAEVDRAQAQVAAAQARLAHSKLELERARRLLDDHAVAQREYDSRANEAQEAEANLAAANAALRAAKLDLGYTQVRAPVAGRVGRIEVTVGNLVAAGPQAPVLTRLVSVSPIYASFDVDEQIVTRALAELPGKGRSEIGRIPVEMGTAADVGTPHRGRLQLVDNLVDAASGTLQVRARFDNPDGSLIPGQFVRVRMGRAKASMALLVSERAIGTDQDKKFVMVVGADDVANYREVKLGAAVEGLRIVTEGLKAGERIVVNGLQRVRPGAKVAPQPVAMDFKNAPQAAAVAGARS